MDDLRPVAFLRDDDVLLAFGATDDGPIDRAAYGRVMAHELVRARRRVNLYRTLYASFLEAGMPFMVENLDDGGEAADGAVPAKLVFSDDPGHVAGVDASGGVNVWTEPLLLQALAQERAVQGFFTDLLQELRPVR